MMMIIIIYYSSSSDYGLSVRTNSKIKNPHRMSSKSSNLSHRRILPQDDLIKRVTMRRY